MYLELVCPTNTSRSQLLWSYQNGFLYVKTAKDGKWGIPGGKVDLFEPAAIAAPREVAEELGIETVIEKFLGVWSFRSNRESSVVNFVYSGKIVEGTPHSMEPEKIISVESLSLKQIRNLHRKGEIRSGLANVEPVERFLAGIEYSLDTIRSFTQ